MTEAAFLQRERDNHICASGESDSPKARASSGVRPFFRVRLTGERENKKKKVFKDELFIFCMYCGVDVGQRLSIQAVHDLRLALDLLLSLG